MATIGRDSNGRRRILFYAGDGTRKTIRLGAVSKGQATAFKIKIESLIGGLITGVLDDEVCRWLAALPDDIHARIAAVGLTKPRVETGVPETPTLKKLHTEVFASLRGKEGTKAAHKQGADSLLEFFGERKLLSEIAVLDAEKWQQSLYADGYAEATAAKRTQTAKMMFRRAVRWEMSAKNPFESLKLGSQRNKARQRFIAGDVVKKIMESANPYGMEGDHRSGSLGRAKMPF